MWMASAIDFVMIFVSLELVSISFYVLVSFTRRNPATLEAGVKYLDPERALDRLSRLRHHLDFRRDWRNESRADRGLPSRRSILIRVPAPFRDGAGPGRARVQDRRRAVPDLGSGCLSRRADAGDGLSFRRFEGGRFRRSPAGSRAVFHSAAGRSVCSSDRRADSDLWQSRRASADESQTAARLLEHCSCWLSAHRRRLVCPASRSLFISSPIW